MPTLLKYALSRKGPKRLHVVVEGNFASATILLDEVKLARIEGRDRLLDGATVAMPDGRALTVRLGRGLLFRALELEIDRQPLPGSVHDVDTAIGASLSWVRWVVGCRVAFLAWDATRIETWTDELIMGELLMLFPCALAVVGGLALWRKHRSGLLFLVAAAVTFVGIDWLANVGALWWSFVWASMFVAAAFRARSLLDVSRLSTTGLGGTETSAGVGAAAPPPPPLSSSSG